jgi:hypothetical protein
MKARGRYEPDKPVFALALRWYRFSHKKALSKKKKKKG